MKTKLLSFKLLLLVALSFLSSTTFGQYSGTGTFNKISTIGELADGYYVIAGNSTNKALMLNTSTGSTGYINATTVTTLGTSITNPAVNNVFKISFDGTNYVIHNEAANNYVSLTNGTSNSATFVTTAPTSKEKWTVTQSGGLFEFINSSFPTRKLNWNSSATRFACYTTTQIALTLYKLSAPSYSITYNGNANTGGNVPAVQTGIAGGASVTLANNTGTLVRGGHAFNGWNTVQNGNATTHHAAGSTYIMPSQNVTMYADWRPVDITVSNNGTQVAAANVVQGANDHVLSKFVVHSADAASTLKSVMLNGTGTYHKEDITAFKLWRTSGATFTSPTLVKSFTSSLASGLGETLMFDLINESIAKDASAYFWVTVSLSPTAVTGRTVGTGIIDDQSAYLEFDESRTTFTGSASAGGLQTITANMAPHFLIENPTNLNFGTVCINTPAPTKGTFDLYGYNLTGNATVGPLAGYSFSIDDITYSPSLTMVPDGVGSFAEKIYVRFLPTIAQPYNGNVSITGGGAPAQNVAVTGAGTHTNPVVTATGANPVLNTKATLAGNVTNLGACPVIIEKGFVYAKKAENATPTVGGANVIKVQVGTGVPTTGAYSQEVTGLSTATAYVYRSYVYDGTTYYYSTAAPEFTTKSPATKLVFRSSALPPTHGNTNTNLPNFVVQAQRADNSVDTEYTDAVTLTATPTGHLVGTTVVNAVAGEVGYIGIQFDAEGTYQFTATATGLTSVTSANIIIKNLPANDLCDNPTNLIVNAPATNASLIGATRTAPFSDASKYGINDVWYSFTVTHAADYKITVGGFTGDLDFDLFGTKCPSNADDIIDFAAGSTNPKTLTTRLDAGTYYIRVIGFDTAGSTSAFNIAVSSPKAITSDKTSLAFGNVNKNDNSVSESFNASATFLDANATITITAPTHYEVSLDNNAWATGQTLQADADGFLAATPVYVRFNSANACGATTGKVVLASTGVANVEVDVTATAVVAAPVAIDATNITGTSFVANWNAVPTATSYKVNVYKETGSPAPELVVNGDFETGDKSNWTGTNVTFNISSTSPQSGTYYVTKNNTSTNQLEQTIAVEIGKEYSMSFWYKDYTASGANGLKNFTIQGTSGSSYIDGDTPIKLPAASSWTKYEKVFTATQNSIKISIRAYESVSIDNISIKSTEGGVIKTPIAGSPFTVAAPATSANITGLEADTDYYYTVEALVDACASVASNEIAVSTADRVIWDGTAWNNVDGPNAQVNAEIAGVYDVTTDFVAKDLSVTTGSLAIQPGHSVTVHGALSQSADDLITVESDASLVQVEGSTVDDKKITVKRNANVPANQYNLWSSPVVAQDLYALYGAAGPVPADKVMEYITKTDTFKPMAAGSKSASAKGYSALGLASNDVTAIFNGVPHNGPVSYNAGANAGQGDGYNLIGNPYPSNFDLDKFYLENESRLDVEIDGDNAGDNTAYFWDNTNNTAYGQWGSTYNGDNYAVYNFSAQSGNPAPALVGGKVPTKIIKPGQGFIVKLKNTTSSLNFDNTMRTSDTSPVYFKTEAPKRFWLELTTPRDLIISTAVVYNEAAVNTYDKYDTAANTFASDGFYTMTSNAKAVSIQGRQDVNIKDDVVPVGIKAYEAGDYSIRFAKGDNIFADGQDVYLKDNSLNKIVKLTDAGYHFALDKGVNTTRFEIVYQSKTLAVDAVNSQKDIVVYKDADSFVVKARSNAITKVEVYDMLGRLVLVSDKASKEVRIANASLVEGTYVLKISQNNNIVTQKVIK